MKSLFTLILIILLYACGSPAKGLNSANRENTDQQTDTIRIANEELEYEIIILEVGFESWLVTQRPMWFYSKQYLANRNWLNVSEWNRRVTNPLAYRSDLYMNLIDYEPHIDYGLEVNYLLFMYFEFFQQKYNQRLYF